MKKHNYIYKQNNMLLFHEMVYIVSSTAVALVIV